MPLKGEYAMIIGRF